MRIPAVGESVDPTVFISNRKIVAIKYNTIIDDTSIILDYTS